MPTSTVTSIQKLAQLADLWKHGLAESRALEVHYRKGRRSGILTAITWARLPSGRPTRRIIECKDNGKARSYDKQYEVEVTGLISIDAGGQRERTHPAILPLLLP